MGEFMREMQTHQLRTKYKFRVIPMPLYKVNCKPVCGTVFWSVCEYVVFLSGPSAKWDTYGADEFRANILQTLVCNDFVKVDGKNACFAQKHGLSIMILLIHHLSPGDYVWDATSSGGCTDSIAAITMVTGSAGGLVCGALASGHHVKSSDRGSQKQVAFPCPPGSA